MKEKILEDWGKEDVFGPWTPPHKEGEPLKFYKSYWLITTDKKPEELKKILEK